MSATATLLSLIARGTRLSGLKRYGSTVAQQSKTNIEEGLIEHKERAIPMVPKTRDSTAVLKALASTVEPTEHEIVDGISPPDPMYPSGAVNRLKYVKHQEAGRKAADYVIHRWPEMFKSKKLDFEPLEEPEKTLEYYISKGNKAGRMMKKYDQLKEKGETIPLDTKNEVLAIVAFFGLRCPYIDNTRKRKVYSKQKDISWWTGERKRGGSSLQESMGTRVTSEQETIVGAQVVKEGDPIGQGSVKEEAPVEGSVKEKAPVKESVNRVSAGTESPETTENTAKDSITSRTRREGGVKIWSMDNLAEKLFREDFEEKNGKTYEAMIQGLVKHKYYKRAFQLFDEMRSLNFQAQTCTYNLLLSALADEDLTGPLTWEQATALLKIMQEDSKATPNTETFNHLLQIASCSNQAVGLIPKTLREMLHIGIEPYLGTFTIVLEKYWELGMHHCIVEEMMDYLEQNPRVIQLQSTDCNRFFGTAMSACTHVPDPEAGTRLVNLYRDHGNSGLLQERISFWENYLGILSNNGCFDQFVAEHKRLIPLDLPASEFVYSKLIRSLVDKVEPKVFEDIWNDMQKFNIKIQNWRTLQAISDFFSRIPQVHVEETERYLKILDVALQDVLDSGGLPAVRTINCVVKLASQVQHAEKAWKYYQLYDTVDAEPNYSSMMYLLQCHEEPKYKEKVILILNKMVSMNMMLREDLIRHICKMTKIDGNTCSSFIRDLSGKTVRGKYNDRSYVRNDERFERRMKTERSPRSPHTREPLFWNNEADRKANFHERRETKRKKPDQVTDSTDFVDQVFNASFDWTSELDENMDYMNTDLNKQSEAKDSFVGVKKESDLDKKVM